MQYTGSSLSQMLVNLFAFLLWPKREKPIMSRLFPGAGSRFKSLVPDTVLDRLVWPIFSVAGRYLPLIRIVQQGRTHLYVLYIPIIVIILLIWGGFGVPS
jgi:hydrogenase-4 component B